MPPPTTHLPLPPPTPASHSHSHSIQASRILTSHTTSTTNQYQYHGGERHRCPPNREGDRRFRRTARRTMAVPANGRGGAGAVRTADDRRLRPPGPPSAGGAARIPIALDGLRRATARGCAPSAGTKVRVEAVAALEAPARVLGPERQPSLRRHRRCVASCRRCRPLARGFPAKMRANEHGTSVYDRRDIFSKHVDAFFSPSK